MGIKIDRQTGIPLIGSNAFGLIDRNTSIIEVKPITGCNLDCIFCSVDEGKSSKKVNDFVVDKDYLVEEFIELADFKRQRVEAHINAHGEPLLYPDIVALIKAIKDTKRTYAISMDTNGTLLNEKLVDELIEAGMTRFNLSINALTPEVAKKLCNTASYDVEKMKRTAEYIAKNASKKGVELFISPVYLQGFNDEEIPKLIEFAKNLNAKAGIQNFLEYRFGRKPAKQLSWKRFYEKLKEWEKKYSIKLVLGEKDFKIKKTLPLPKPFNKGDIIEATVKCYGRYKNEKILAADNRNITVYNCKKEIGETAKIKILRAKHNVFFGKCL